MSRVPIRVRLAALLALAMMLVLAGAGLFVYLRLADDLSESVDATLAARAGAVAASGRVEAGSAGDAEDGFAMMIAADGPVLSRTDGSPAAALSGPENRSSPTTMTRMACVRARVALAISSTVAIPAL